ncbi:MAG TPA: hypothetical protein VE172_10290 [Stackebrandtia sp.]|jgi:predicted nucleotidyltransferase|uniref:hypothetical protein n=1 Tax=Stackebrandtia sp. TaxID=2023065 RepID=UPI002D4645A3|nr:hypothetical protein [Stackebrandtia sp.]HZE39187.1 hypothetical protein [Stackebrandtia sp.]
MTDLLAAQASAIERAKTVLPRDERILAVYLIGSNASGRGDAYSDVDLHCVVADADVDGGVRDFARLIESIAGPLVHADRIPGVTGGLGITPDWLHVDLIFHGLSEYDPDQYDAVLPLFDRRGDVLPGRRMPDDTPGEPYFPSDVVNLFLYFLGKLVTVLGREEYVVAHSGLAVRRDLLSLLMCAERGVHRSGGAKRLNPFLDDERRARLEAVPAAGADREQILAAERYLTAEFLRRGRALAKRTGGEWPYAFEEATLAHLRRHLGVDFG